MKMRRLDSTAHGFDAELARLTAFDSALDERVETVVRSILQDVRARGDEALLEYTRRFDHLVVAQAASLELPRDTLTRALEELPRSQRQALEQAAERIRTFHEHQRMESWSVREADGTELGQRVTP
ncbi:MAG: histidinol dehydrogenase, partial [Ferrovum sp.]|nr:histidinol dehydrogenase [Ferrovum sp.]